MNLDTNSLIFINSESMEIPLTIFINFSSSSLFAKIYGFEGYSSKWGGFNILVSCSISSTVFTISLSTVIKNGFPSIITDS